MEYKAIKITLFGIIWFMINLLYGILSIFVSPVLKYVGNLFTFIAGFAAIRLIFGYDNYGAVLFLIGANFIQIALLIIFLSQFK